MDEFFELLAANAWQFGAELRLLEKNALGSASPFSSEVPSAGKSPPKSTSLYPTLSTPSKSPVAPVAPPKPVVSPPAPPPPAPLRPAFDTDASYGPTPTATPQENQPNPLAMSAMAGLAPGAAAYGGMPMMMSMWDLANNGGKNFNTIFGDVIQSRMPQFGSPGSAFSNPSQSPPMPANARQSSPPPPIVAAPPQSPPAPAPAATGSAPTGAEYTPEIAPQEPDDRNWMEQGRDWLTRNTSTGTIGSGDVQVDPGRLGVDGLLPYMASKTRPVIGLTDKIRGLLDPKHRPLFTFTDAAGKTQRMTAGGKLMGKAPGMLPLTFALDAADLGGVNPFTDRFGKGPMGMTEAAGEAEAVTQQSAPMQFVSSFTQPLTTLHRGFSSQARGMGEMFRAMNDQQKTMRIEQAAGKEPDLRMTAPSQHFFRSDGTSKGFGEAVKDLHRKSWENSKVPIFNYIQTLAEANAEGGLNLWDQTKRNQSWREWAGRRQAELQSSTDPRAQADLVTLKSQQDAMKETLPERIINNPVRSIGSVLAPGATAAVTGGRALLNRIRGLF